ncbi:hypothetical protein [Runella sp.]|jgi:hypothetical protein|uniref:hypothetical protein n=1 Tax=Runella sp. TaxID=1960881 RepID=UPI0026131B95|nr:hypothetical protein [Runella sp.]
MFEIYRKKVRLLIQVIPFVKEAGCFALHGGTAINLFVREQCFLMNDNETISIMEFGDTAEGAFLKCLNELPYFLGAK